jgi:alkyl hydroperoxide reductase subunit D
METLASLREQLPEAAKDIKLNLQTVLSGGPLSMAQRWGVVVAAALTSRHPELSRVLVQEARKQAGDAVVEDAVAAAALMGMNNVFYRFRHRIGKEEYSEKPARLRMNRLAKPATNRADFELFSLAVSAINDCETCVRAHEQAVIEAGISTDAVLDAVRIAATVHGAAVALDAAAALAHPTAALREPMSQETMSQETMSQESAAQAILAQSPI